MDGLRFVMVVGLVLAAGASVSRAQTGIGQAEESSAAARRRMREVLTLVEKGDPAAATAYVDAHFAPEAVGTSAGEALAAFAELHERTRGLDLAACVATGPAEATAEGTARLTEEATALRVRVEPRSPYRVISIGRVRPAARPAPPPHDAAACAPRLDDRQIADAVDAYVNKLADADAFSGVVLLARGGRPFLLRAYGQANKDFAVPNTPDTRFNLGSITKMFTAVAVLQLAQRGQLSLDDPLARFLPDVPDPESAGRITVRQLLTHTAGLGDHVSAMARDPFRARYRTVERMVELVRNVPPLFEPGTRWRYSNSGFLLLGRVVEKASGRDYYDYVRRNVFAAAGMDDTDFCELDRVNPRLAVGYEREFSGGRGHWRSNHFDQFVRGGPEGGAYSTARDLLRFDRALRENRLLGPTLTALATAAYPAEGSPGYGHGFEVEEAGRIVGHGGSFVGAHAKLDMYPGADFTAVVLSNYGGAARPVVARIRRLLGPAAAK